jgi:pullulanase
MNADILAQRRDSFMLWQAAQGTPPPALVIGQLLPGAPVSLVGEQHFDMSQSPQFSDLWVIEAAACNLTDGQVYHYWFEVTDTHPERSGQRIRVTDPMAFMVDWRLRAPQPMGPAYGGDDRYPAAVIKYVQGALVPCDAGGETGDLLEPPPIGLPVNNRIVSYELPTAWARTGSDGLREQAVGTFRDVLALIDHDATGANFADLDVTNAGRSYLAEELGVNVVQLLPPADSLLVREWGYGTTNFLAPDFELGFPADSSHPTPNRDLRDLVAACHAHTMRFFVDVVMAFARTSPYLAAATDDFFILHPCCHPSDPDAHNSRGKDDSNFRDGIWQHAVPLRDVPNGYDPVSGQSETFSPAAKLMQTALLRWMNDFHIDGIRMDSVENVFSWNFIGKYRDLARSTWRQRFGGQYPADEADARFIVVGEELQEPLDILRQERLDGLWHENFKRYIRAALLGQGIDRLSFEETVRRAIDCRSFGYTDMSEAVIYLTSHDVEGFRNERLFNFFRSSGVADVEKRTKLAFACLLTAVGVPQILAGDEFADQHDLFDQNGQVTQAGGKQVDPVNYSRLNEDWRARIKDYVARLIKFRTTNDALAVNDTSFIHIDLDAKQVLAWQRGQPGSDQVVVVVANFSDFTTPPSPSAEYIVHNWPSTPPGRRWREISQDRDVPPEWVGREPIFAWEAKIYTMT